MASLSGQDVTTAQIKSKYAKRVEIFMEGKDDLAVYNNYWFGHLADRVQFRLAEDGPAQHPGCKGVEKNVEIQRLAGIRAYGIIDRDYVDDVLTACSTDDVQFINSNNAKNPHLYFTVRWELENYLIDAEIWERERVDLLHRGDGRRLTKDVVAELIDHCLALIPHAAVNAFRKERGQLTLGDGACRVYLDRAAVQEWLDKHILAGLSAVDLQNYHQWVARVDAFDDPNASPDERLMKLARRIHGKALFDRFCYKHKLHIDIRFSVARAMGANAPVELRDRVGEWAS